MIITKGYYIPYSSKAIHTLRKAEQKLGIRWSVDANECVNIQVKKTKVKALEDMIKALV